MVMLPPRRRVVRSVAVRDTVRDYLSCGHSVESLGWFVKYRHCPDCPQENTQGGAA